VIKLSNEEKISQVTDLLSKAEKAEESRDDQGLCKYLKEFFSLYEPLTPEFKKKIEQKQLYFAHKHMGRIFFILKQYKNALHHLEEARKLSEFNNEDLMTRIQIDHAMVTSKLPYLETNNKSDLKDVKKISYSLLRNISEIQDENLKYEIKNNQAILKAIIKGDVKTVITFEIPPPLFINQKVPIEFIFNNVLHALNVEIVKNPCSGIEGGGDGFVGIIEDKFGLVNRSKITLTISKYINPDERANIKTFSDKNQISKALLDAINSLNYFIGHYRVVTGDYWIETIFYKMVETFNCNHLGIIRKVQCTSSTKDQGMYISPRAPYLNAADLDNLTKCLKIKALPLWNILLLDAKDYLLRRNYREAIYAINGAFENYLMLRAREILSKVWGEKDANDYLKGKPAFRYHKLRKRINEETFNKCVKKGIIEKMVPSTNQILKECFNVHELGIDWEELDGMVGKIRRKRNEIMHGAEIDEKKYDLELIAFEAVENFEKFIEIF
jgi:hypothetical protein